MEPSPPRFRRDLVATPAEEDGVQYIDVSDPGTGRRFRFYDFEHAVALALDGRPIEQVAAALNETAGIELTVAQVATFVRQLEALGFLVPEPARAATGDDPDADDDETTTIARTAPASAPASRPNPEPAPEPPPTAEPEPPPAAEPEPPPARAPTPPAPARKRRGPLLAAVLGLGAALAIGAGLFRLLSGSPAAPVAVRAAAFRPTSAYRWFDPVGSIKAASGRTLAFPSAGRVARVLPAGRSVAAGEVVAALEVARRFENELAHHRARLAHYERRLAEMQAAGNRPEARQAEIKIVEKKRLAAEAQTRLAAAAVIAPSPGEIAEALTAVGAEVAAGAPAARMKGSDFRAEIELAREEAALAHRLGFCQVEVDGKPLGCSLAPDAGSETRVVLELPPDPAVAPGKPVRLARVRYDAVFLLPEAAVVRIGQSERVYLVAPDRRAEARAVTVAERAGGQAIVTQGLDQDDLVVLDPPPGLRPGAALGPLRSAGPP